MDISKNDRVIEPHSGVLHLLDINSPDLQSGLITFDPQNVDQDLLIFLKMTQPNIDSNWDIYEPVKRGNDFKTTW